MKRNKISTKISVGNNATSSIDWLKNDGSLAKRAIYFTTILKIGALVANLVMWIGLSFIAQAGLDFISHQHLQTIDAYNLKLGGSLLVAGLFGDLLLSYGANQATNQAIRHGKDHRQKALLAYILPESPQQAHPESSLGATILLDHVNEIAEYRGKAEPLRIATPIEMGIIIALLLILHWPAAIILGLATAVVPMNMWIAGQITQDGHDHYLDQLNYLSARILDAFRGLGTLIRFDGLKRQREQLQEDSDELVKTNFEILKRAFLSGMIMDVVVTFSMAVIATYVGMSLLHYISIGPKLSLLNGLAVLLITPVYFKPFRETASAFHQKENARADTRQIEELTQAQALVVVPHEEKLTVAPQITLKDVELKLKDDLVIEMGNLNISAGEHVAIIGPSGSGKTTLLKVIAGVLPVSKGQVLWNGGKVQPDLRETAWIGQQTLILDDTLRANLLIGQAKASDQDLLDAMQTAQLTDWLAFLEENYAGLDTLLGHQGIQPSAGEKKRLAIARATLRNAQIWLIDEPTAHLDYENEQSVAKALADATQSITTITVTHSAEVIATFTTTYAFNKRHQLGQKPVLEKGAQR